MPSGGTLATVLGLFDVFPFQEVQAASTPYAQSPIPHQEPTRPKSTILDKVFGVRDVRDLGTVTTSVAGTVDAAIVERTWGLLSEIPSRKEQFYGPKFTWVQYFKARNWLHGIAIHWALLIGGFLLAFVPPFRNLVKKFVYQPGQGPAREETKNEEVEYRGVAFPDTKGNTKQQAYCRAWFRGSMYERKW